MQHAALTYKHLFSQSNDKDDSHRCLARAFADTNQEIILNSGKLKH